MKFIKYFALSLVLLLTNVSLSEAQVQVSMPDTSGTKPDTMLVPIRVSDLSIQDVFSAQFTIDYNPSVVQTLGLQRSGTLSANWPQPATHFTSGQVTMAFATADTLRGSGVLIYLKMRLLPNASPDSTALTFTEALFNEGSPAANIINGKIRIRAIHISPQQGSLFEGDTLQFSVNGTVTPPVNWSLTDPSVAEITSSGEFHALSRGFTKVIAVDDAGLADTTDNIIIESVQLRDLTLAVHDTAHTQTLAFDLPIYISDVSGLGIYSGQFTVNYDPNDLTALGGSAVGAMTESWGNPTVNLRNGAVDIATAGTTTLADSGVFVFVRFRVKPNATGSSDISVSDALFNEDILANTISGRFSVLNAPEIQISPENVVLTNGDTKQFSASGGTAPYSWGTTNDEVATIDQSGLLTTYSSGVVRVFTQDAENFVDTTNVIAVNDLEVSLPDTNVRQGSQVSIPLRADRDVTLFNIYSFEFSIAYSNSQNFEIDTVLTTGTVSSTWGDIAMTDSGGVLTVAAAGSTPLSGAGALLSLVFSDTSGAPLGTTSNLEFQRFLFNEGTPSVTPMNGQVTVSQMSVNNPPVAVNDTSTINEDTAVEIHVLENDTDPDGDIVHISGIDSSQTVGHVSINAGDTTVTYTPELNFSGVDSFQYSISDGQGGSGDATVRLVVNPVNDPPSSFSLLSPPDSSEIFITNDNLEQTLTFQWEEAQDIDGDQVTYKFQVSSGNLSIIAFADTGATTVTVTYQELVNALNAGGVEQVTGDWTILATDGQDTTAASNGPRNLTVDATTVGVADETNLPQKFTLEQNYPNPFNPTTTIRYSIPEAAYVSITVYNILGERIVRLLKKQQSAGRYSVVWNGTNEQGREVSTGMYFYRIEANKYSAMKKMVLAK